MKGAGVIIVSYGMPQLLYTKEITSPLYKNPETLSPLEIPAAELTHGSAYFWPAGAKGSTDWMSKHGVWRHPDSRSGQRRIAFIFRAIDPNHKREYKLRYPYCMVAPSRKRDSDGNPLGEHATQPAVWK